MPNSRILALSIALIVTSFATLNAVELGDPSDFAVRFDETTGNLSALIYKNEIVTTHKELYSTHKEPGTKPYSAQSPDSPQRFDILQNDKWAFGLAGGKLELVGIKKESDSTVMVTQKIGDWTVTFRYVLSGRPTILSWNAELMYTGKEPTKIKSFWMAYPSFPFGDESEFVVPGLYPPRKFTPDNFAVGAKQGLWRSGSPLVFQLDKKKSVLLFSNQLESYADRPGGDVSRNENGVRLVQSFDTKGHIKPGLAGKQYVGVGSLRIVDGDSESALLKLHDLMRHFGHVVPKDRPQWFKEAIAYSMHPGGTTGSMCKDLGGFLPTLEMLPRIKELGCNVIWFMPLEDKSIYWPRDYYKLQSGLGSTDEKAPEEYKAVVKKAHELGLRVVQDSVPHGGGNTNDRAKEHPYWLAQNEDGSTLDYWCFDFNWPSWIDYMAEVSRFYVKTYGIDGFRIDACGGSKIPNWNPEIPYSRASHSQSQGGLNMVRAIRKALKDEKPDGATLAEVNGSLFGAVSDAVYDFDLCYNVLHDARKQTPEEFVKRIRRWLHEQQYSEIPDLLRLRHVESHDSLRAQLWYGTEPHRALVALTTFIHGIPLIYHEQEIGHWESFVKMFATRRALPELNGGDVDYQCIDAPPGVFACLRTKGDDASIVLINFNDDSVFRYTVEMPWNRLPEKLRQGDRLWVTPEHNRLLFGSGNYTIEKTGDRLRIAPVEGEEWDPENPTLADAIHLSPFEWKVVVLRQTEEAIHGYGRDIMREKYRYVTEKNNLQSLNEKQIKNKEEQIQANSSTENTLKLTDDRYTAYIDAETGLLRRFDYSEISRGEMQASTWLGNAELLLPPGWQEKARKAKVTQTEKEILAQLPFGNDTMLEIRYSKSAHSKAAQSGIFKNDSMRWIEIDCQWSGKNIPKSSAMLIPAIGADRWRTKTDGAIGGLYDVFYPRRKHPDGFYGSIYWRPQGTQTIFDSLLSPFAKDSYGQWLNASIIYGSKGLDVGSVHSAPIRFRFLESSGDRQGLMMLVSMTDENSPQLSSSFGAVFQLGSWIGDKYQENKLRPTTGGWIFENEYYRLRLARNGQIMSLHKKGAGDEAIAQSPDRPGSSAEYRSASGSLIQGGDIYTDYGYGKEKTKYAASFDVETGIRIVQDEDGTLRLRFEGQLRGFYRFDLMRPPVEYFTEYALSEKSSALGFSCGVKTNRAPTDNRAFLALMLPMPTVEQFEYHFLAVERSSSLPTVSGTNVDAKGRSFQCRDGLPDRVLLKDGKENLLELTGLKGEASNLFLDRKNFFVTFDDGENLDTPGQWRSFTATLSMGAAHDSAAPKVTPASCDLRSQTNSGLLVDGGFEAISSNDLVSLRTGAVLKGQRGYATGWQTPPQGSVMPDIFRSGKSSAKVVGETAQYRHFEQEIAAKNLKPGQKLRLTAWAKGDDLKRGPESWQTGSVRLVATVDGKIQYASVPALLGTFDWKEVSVNFTVPEKLQRLSVQVGVNGAAGTIWIDDARLETQP